MSGNSVASANMSTLIVNVCIRKGSITHQNMLSLDYIIKRFAEYLFWWICLWPIMGLTILIIIPPCQAQKDWSRLSDGLSSHAQISQIKNNCFYEGDIVSHPLRITRRIRHATGHQWPQFVTQSLCGFDVKPNTVDPRSAYQSVIVNTPVEVSSSLKHRRTIHVNWI